METSQLPAFEITPGEEFHVDNVVRGGTRYDVNTGAKGQRNVENVIGLHFADVEPTQIVVQVSVEVT